MQSLTRHALFWLLCLLPLCALAQENRVVVVGVATMKNDAGRSVPGTLERDRLVTALNDEKRDKKLHVKIQGVPLDGMTPEETASQAADKKCDYVVYTILTELRTQGDPVQHRPGYIETNPNSQWSTRGGPESAAMNPEFRATVEYKLYRTGDPSAISGAPFSTQEAMPEIDVVSQVMNQIANLVFAEVVVSFADTVPLPVASDAGGSLPQKTWEEVAHADPNMTDKTTMCERYAAYSEADFAGTGLFQSMRARSCQSSGRSRPQP